MNKPADLKKKLIYESYKQNNHLKDISKLKDINKHREHQSQENGSTDKETDMVIKQYG